MTNSGKYKALVCLTAVIVLLSFFYMVPVMTENVTAQIQKAESVWAEHEPHAAQELSGKAIPDAMALLGVGSRPAAYPDSITAARTEVDEIATREQHAPRILIVRFLAVMSMQLLLIHMICGILMRRYGCHMIDLWENIYYIHLVDGKKDAPFLECYI